MVIHTMVRASGRLLTFGCLMTAPSVLTAQAASNEAVSDNAAYWGSPIVVTATRTPIDVADAPVTISVITDEQMADDLVTDIRDMVRYEPGITVRRQPARFNAALSATGRAGNEGFTVRGIGGNRVLIQVDGVRVPYGFSFGAQDVGLIKSVEILRGPTSALYGTDGLAGAISFRTADPVDFIAEGRNFGGFLRAGYSSVDDEFAETAVLAGRSGAWSAMAAYTRRDWRDFRAAGTHCKHEQVLRLRGLSALHGLPSGYRVLHRGHIVLGDGIENIADEQIGGRVAIGQQRRTPAIAVAVRGFVDDKRQFGIPLTLEVKKTPI